MAAVQLILAFFAGWFCYIVVMPMAMPDAPFPLIGQLISGAFCTPFAVLFCLILGLPIRLVSTWRKTWESTWWLPFFVAALGLALIVLAWQPPFRLIVHDNESGGNFHTGEPALIFAGWLFIVFAALHCWLPLFGFSRQDVPHQRVSRERTDLY